MQPVTPSNHRLNVSIAVLSAMVMSTISATAAFKDGPVIGMAMGGDTETDSLAIGYQFTYESDSPVAVEISATRHEDDLSGTGIPELVDPLASTVGLEIYSLAATVQLRHRSGPFHWYLGGGIAAYLFESEVGDIQASIREHPGVGGGENTRRVNAQIDIDDEVGYHAAIGISSRLSENWEWFGEYRQVFLENTLRTRFTEINPQEDNNAASDIQADTTTRNTEYDYNHGLLRLGVSYRF